MASMTTVLNLEEVRRRNGVSLQQISETTKISTYFLRAIESEEFDKLPGGVFNVNYIRQYAAAIGFSEGKLLEYYKAHTDARERETSGVVPPVNPRRGWSFRIPDWLRSPFPRNS